MAKKPKRRRAKTRRAAVLRPKAKPKKAKPKKQKPRRAKPSLRVFLRDRYGRMSSYRRSVSYELWWGKKRLLTKKFTAHQKLISQKKEFLKKVVYKFLTAKRASKRTAKTVRAVPLPKTKIGKTRSDRIALFTGYIEEEEIDFDRVKFENALALKEATLGFVLKAPYRPKRSEYTLAHYEKRISSITNEILNLTILKFTLKNSIYIDEDNFKDTAGTAVSFFVSHLLDFYLSTRDYASDFIFRLRFKYGNGPEIAVSYVRTKIHSAKDMVSFLYGTFDRLRGNRREPFKTLQPLSERRNYLIGGQSVYITGFTIEAMSKERQK